MKSEDLRKAIGGVDDDLIEAAKKPEKNNKKNIWSIVMPIAAAAAVVLAAAITIPGIIKSNRPETDSGKNTSIEGGGERGEFVFEKGYTYRVDSGKYASYEKGRVIEDGRVGEKLEGVTVTAGWVDRDGKQLTEEHAKAEIFRINGVSEDTAVAIRFLDELEAQLTTCYYVIMNPDADLTPIQDYIIEPVDPAVSGGNEATPE